MSLFEQASICVTPNGYKEDKLYSIKPTSGAGDLDVVRATGATRVNASGLIETVANNVPRLDYPPLGGCPSILVEPQRTNLLLRSEEFDDATWTKLNSSITANTAVAPDGNTTADRLVFNNGASGTDVLRQNLTFANTTCCFSIFYKDSPSTLLRVVFAGTLGSFVNWNATTGEVSSPGANFISLELINFPNGWKKVNIVMLNTFVGVSSIRFGAASYTGNGVDGILIWGAQLEEGAYATSYIPTVASAVTRNADVISKTGISDLIGQTEGVLFVDFIAETPSEIRRISLSQNASNRILITHQSNGRIQFFGNESAITQFTFITSEVYTKGDRVKVALAYKQNDFAGYVNGVQMFTDNSGDIPALLPNFNFSDPTIGQTPLIGSVNQALLFKTRLSNETLEQLTTL